MSEHGGDIFNAALEYGCSAKDIIDFSSNMNICSPKIKKSFKPHSLVAYAESSYKKLQFKIASHYEMKMSQCRLFNGTSSAIIELFAYLKPKQTFLYAPLYGEYRRASHQFSKQTYYVNRFENLEQKIPKKSTVVFVNPSTPDGKFHDLKKLLKQWIRQDCTIIIDESFIEFEDLPSIKAAIDSYDKLYVIQSLSKYYACAGVRVGALFSQKKNLEKMFQTAWPISTYDEFFILNALKDTGHKKRSYKLHVKQKRELYTILKSSKLFKKIYSSSANYILAELDSLDGKIFSALMLEDKILVRDCANFKGLKKNHIRFAVKDGASQKQLKKVLDALT